MILQDPFVLDHNITQNVNQKMVVKVIKEMRLAEAKAMQWFDVAHAESKSLMDILGEEVPEGFEIPKIRLSQTVSQLGPYQFVIDMNMEKISRADFQTLEASGNVNLCWCKKMMVFLYRMIERVLMFDCQVADMTLPVNPNSLKSSRKYSIYRTVSEPFRPSTATEEGQESEAQEHTEMEGQEEAWENQEEAGTSQASGSNYPGTSQDYNQSTKDDKSATTKNKQNLAEGDSVEHGDDEEYPQREWSSVEEGQNLPSVVDGTELVAVMDPDNYDEEDEEEERRKKEEEQRIEEEDQQHDPSYIVYDYQGSDYHIDMDVKVMCRIWVERKNLMKELKERGFKENLQLEQTVSERLFYEVHGPMRRPVTEFRCVMRSIMTENGASVLIDCMADTRQKEYDCIYHYMKKFATKAVEKFFYA